MALPYKLIKSMTIDGVTQGLDPDLGRQWNASLNKNIPTANTDIAGASLTITEAGTYLFTSRWEFAAATTTGTRNITLTLWYKPNGGAWTISSNATQIMPGPNRGSRLSVTVAIGFTESQLPATVTLYAVSDKTSSTAMPTSLGATKLIDVYNMGGGNP